MTYPHINFDECRTCTSEQMELNAKSYQEWDGRTDRQTDGEGKSLKPRSTIVVGSVTKNKPIPKTIYIIY